MRQRGTARPLRRQRLLLEALEDRCTPSTIWYVNDDATGANTGTSWADAFPSLRTGLAAAQPGDQVWVARGTYPGGFALRDAVAVYGGFAGTERVLSERDFRQNVSVLSGGSPVVVANAMNSGLLDGFTITGGQGFSRGHTTGGVEVSASATLALANLIITGNIGVQPGAGGLYNGGTVTLTDVAITNNQGDTSGGMWNTGTASLTNVSFIGNFGSYSSAGLTNSGTAALTNATFFGNQGGAGSALSSSGPLTLTNVTSSGNQAAAEGAAFLLQADASFTDCILWGDTAPGTATEIRVAVSGATVTVTYSDVQGGYPGAGNMNADPLFVDPANGDLRLRPGSPAIDAGTNVGAPSFDRDNNPRPVNATGRPTALTDMGAYEVQVRPPLPLVAVGTQEGVPGYVALYNAGGQRFTLQPYGDFTGGIRVAVADFDADGVEDLVTVPGPGGTPTVKVYSSATGAVLARFDAYGSSFTGGVYVAAADVLGLGAPQVLTGPGAGGAPFVQVWDLRTGPRLAASLQAFGEAFTGGVTVSGSAGVLVAGAASQSGFVKVFDGPGLSRARAFQAFGSPFAGGVTVAAQGNYLAVGQVAGTSLVNVFRLADLSLATTLVPQFGVPPAAGAAGGTSVAWTRQADGTFNLLTGTGPGWPAEVQYWVAGTWQRRTGFRDFGGYPGGLWVA